jgi:hypothetical protein
MTPHDVAASEYVAVLAAGPYVYVYAGPDRHALRDRAQMAAHGMTAANLDTKITWLQPDHFIETHRRLCERIGPENVFIMGEGPVVITEHQPASYERRQIQRVLDAGPADGWGDYTLIIGGKEKTKTLSVTAGQVRRIAAILDTPDDGEE